MKRNELVLLQVTGRKPSATAHPPPPRRFRATARCLTLSRSHHGAIVRPEATRAVVLQRRNFAARPDISTALTLAIGEAAWCEKVGLRQLCGRLFLCKFPVLPDRDDRAVWSP